MLSKTFLYRIQLSRTQKHKWWTNRSSPIWPEWEMSPDRCLNWKMPITSTKHTNNKQPNVMKPIKYSHIWVRSRSCCYGREQLMDANTQIAQIEEKMKVALLPKDPNDDKNIFLEIRPAAEVEMKHDSSQQSSTNAICSMPSPSDGSRDHRWTV